MASWLAVMLQKVYSQGCCTHTPSWVAIESRFIFFSIYLGSEVVLVFSALVSLAP